MYIPADVYQVLRYVIRRMIASIRRKQEQTQRSAIATTGTNSGQKCIRATSVPCVA